MLIAVALPCALWMVHHGLGHEGDIRFFYEWYLAFREGPAFYVDGPGLNYPIVGVLLVCGPASLVEWLGGAVLGPGALDPGAYRVVLKATLVVAEILFFFAAAGLASALGARRPRRLAVLLGLAPSTWAIGAWFGQIDVWGTVFLLASFTGLVRFRATGRGAHLALGLAALYAALLTKQLTWFAAPALLALAVLGLRAHGAKARVIAAALSPACLFVVDPFLVLPDHARSHLLYVLAHGSAHGQLAVASGASVWSLFVVGGTPSDAVRFLGLSSLVWGILAWSTAELAFVLAVLRRGLVSRRLVLFAGFSHLAMATLLTGVHERYLGHAIPLVLLADLDGPRWRRALGWAVAGLAGIFVLSTIHEEAFAGQLYLLGRPEPLALLSLAWLFSLWAPAERLGGLGLAPRPAGSTSAT